MRKGTLRYRDGWFCIEDCYRDPNKPEIVHFFWPLERTSRSRLDQWLGQWNWSASPPTVDSPWEGAEVICQGWDNKAWEYGRLTLRTPDPCVSLTVEIEPIPCPKVRAGTQVKYENYHWRKLLVKGWTLIE